MKHRIERPGTSGNEGQGIFSWKLKFVDISKASKTCLISDHDIILKLLSTPKKCICERNVPSCDHGEKSFQIMSWPKINQ